MGPFPFLSRDDLQPNVYWTSCTVKQNRGVNVGLRPDLLTGTLRNSSRPFSLPKQPDQLLQSKQGDKSLFISATIPIIIMH